jgi:hypothetical protein
MLNLRCKDPEWLRRRNFGAVLRDELQNHVSAVIYELSDLDHFLRPAAVPVIPLRLTSGARPRAPWRGQTVQPFKYMDSPSPRLDF